MWFKKSRIYADAAAATPMSKRSKRELVRLLGVYGNPGGLHKEGVAAKQELEKARKSIAESIGAHADEVVFTASGTEANNLALQGFLAPFAQAHVITSAIEHSSVLGPLRALEGIETSEVPVDAEGVIFPNAVMVAVRPDTALVSVQLVNSEVGSIQPVKDVAKELRRVRERKVYLHTDASQAPLWLDLNVEQLGVDLMTLDAQKVLGPKGVGALYIRRGTPMQSLIRGGGQERGMRAGTENVAAAGAFAVALADAQNGVGKRVKKVAAVRDYMLSEIQKVIPEVVVNGPGSPSTTLGPTRETRVANNLNISIQGLDAQMAVVALDALGVAASTRSACDIGGLEPSHVIRALGVSPELAGTAIRLTLLPDASYADARRIAAALFEVATRYRRT